MTFTSYKSKRGDDYQVIVGSIALFVITLVMILGYGSWKFH